MHDYPRLNWYQRLMHGYPCLSYFIVRCKCSWMISHEIPWNVILGCYYNVTNFSINRLWNPTKFLMSTQILTIWILREGNRKQLSTVPVVYRTHVRRRYSTYVYGNREKKNKVRRQRNWFMERLLLGVGTDRNTEEDKNGNRCENPPKWTYSDEKPS